MKKINIWVPVTGVVVGLAALVLVSLGNPGNMGFCIACFLRDISGALGLHHAAKVQYVRPEIIDHPREERTKQFLAHYAE